MKKIICCFFLINFLTNCTSTQPDYSDEIKMFQYDLNRNFANAATSPLTKKDLEIFKNLDFFEIDLNYRIKAAFELTPESPLFEMPTTTDRLALYRKFGIARFTLNGDPVELSIYQQSSTKIGYESYLFLPFNDSTNGMETYGGGRYIDLEIPPVNSDHIMIDFNKSYNPYCTYNPRYSCPIPPRENNIKQKIPAGIKAFNLKH